MAITAPDVTPSVVPGIRVDSNANPTTFGGGPGIEEAGQNIQRVADDAGNIGAFEKIRADQTAVEGARAQMSQTLLDKLYNPQSGILKSKGLDALQAGQTGITDLKKNFNDIVNGLNGDEQKGAASKVAIDMVDNANRQVMAHTDNQMTEYHQTAMDSTVQSQSALAALGHGDQKTVDSAIQNVNQATEGFIASQRLDQQSADILRQKNSDMVYSSTIEGMMKHSTGTEAQAFFDANKDKISPETQEKLSDALKENSLTNQSLVLANKYWAGTGQSFTDAYNKTSEIQDPALQKKTRDELKGLEADKKEKFESSQMDLFQQGMNKIQNAKQNGGNQPFDTVVGPMLSTQLEPAKYDALKKMYSGTTETSTEKWTQFSLMTPDQMKNISKDDLQTDWLPDMGNKQDAAMKMWQKAQSNNVDANITHDQNSIIKEYAQNMGVAGLGPGRDPAKLKGDNGKAWLNYMNASQQAILNFEATKLGGTRKATEEETKSVMDGVQMKMIGQKSFLGLPYGGKSVYESQYSTPYEEIPDNAKSDLSTFAKRLGVNATPQQIQRAYYSYEKKDVPGIRKAFQ